MRVYVKAKAGPTARTSCLACALAPPLSSRRNTAWGSSSWIASNSASSASDAIFMAATGRFVRVIERRGGGVLASEKGVGLGREGEEGRWWQVK